MAQMKLDEMIDALVQMRLTSPLKGNTVPYIAAAGYENQVITDVRLGKEGVIITSEALDDLVDELSADALMGQELNEGDEEDRIAGPFGELEAEADNQERIEAYDDLDPRNIHEFEERPDPEV